MHVKVGSSEAQVNGALRTLIRRTPAASHRRFRHELKFTYPRELSHQDERPAS
jgi:hypothetical protein